MHQLGLNALAKKQFRGWAGSVARNGFLAPRVVARAQGAAEKVCWSSGHVYGAAMTDNLHDVGLTGGSPAVLRGARSFLPLVALIGHADGA